MPSMTALQHERSLQRDVILNEIQNYQETHNRITVPLAGVQTLLGRIEAYINAESDCNGPKLVDHVEIESEFDELDDEDLMLAESTKPDVTSSCTKRTTPSEFDDGIASKKSKLGSDIESIAIAESILQKTWGFPNFRLKQEHAISRLITGGNAVVIFPTGGGKSLVYQVPALAFNDYDERRGLDVGNGLTLVVSPLIALMKVSVVRLHFV